VSLGVFPCGFSSSRDPPRQLLPWGSVSQGWLCRSTGHVSAAVDEAGPWPGGDYLLQG